MTARDAVRAREELRKPPKVTVKVKVTAQNVKPKAPEPPAEPEAV